jgi:Do/DeqQ family serine protease
MHAAKLIVPVLALLAACSDPASQSQAQQPLMPQPTRAPPVSAAAMKTSFAPVVKRAAPAVVNVSSKRVVRQRVDPFWDMFIGGGVPRERIAQSLGSGAIVREDGVILTNNHNIEGADEVIVQLADKREFAAKVLLADPKSDLAVLKIDVGGEKLPVIAIDDQEALEVGDLVLAIGNPFGVGQTVTNGIVSATARSNTGITDHGFFIQTDAAINPGNSGGALVNARGELIGINTAIFSQSGGYQGIGFAVPSNLARRVMDDFLKYGAVRRGTIGFVEFAPLTSQLADQLGIRADRGGVVVSRMRRNSPAFQAGLQPLDVVLAFNGQTITDAAQLQRLVQDAKIGTSATFRIMRDGRSLDLKIPIQSTAAR